MQTEQVALRVLPVKTEHPVLAALQELMVPADLQAHPVQAEAQVQQEVQARRDQEAHPVPLVHQVQTEQVAPQEHQD